MIIANPVYDVVFKYLMSDLDIAKGVISRILDKQVLRLDFAATEQASDRGDGALGYGSAIRVYRMDFKARIQEADGTESNVLIELQKAKLGSEALRFRTYLAEEYKRLTPVNREKGQEAALEALPIIGIYIVNFVFEDGLPSATHVQRRYLNAFDRTEIKGVKADLIESLTHDAYFIQVPKLGDRLRNALGNILSIFEQHHFADEKRHTIEYGEEHPDDELLGRVVRCLNKIVQEPEVRETMDIEDQAYAEFEYATQDLRHRLDREQRQKEEALLEKEEERKQKEEALLKQEEERRQKEEERRQKEEERRQKEEIIRRSAKAMGEAGLSDDQIAKILGVSVEEIAHLPD